MLQFLAHAGESQAEPSFSLWTRLMHQPTWVSVGLVLVVLASAYWLATYVLKLGLTAKLASLVLLTIGLSMLYVAHNATVTGIVLSAGFIITFLLTFTLLAKSA